MKKLNHIRCLALLLSLTLLLSGTAFAGSMGDGIGGYTVEMNTGVALTRGVYWAGSDYRTEHYIECAPGSAVYPVTVSGETLCSSASLAAMAAQLEEDGLHVIAGINGDYFNMTSLVPVGIVVQDGILRSSCDGVSAFGLREDGSAVLGRPALNMQLLLNGQSRPLATLNKSRGPGFALFTDDFAATTKNTGKGWDIICTLTGEIRTKCVLDLTVEEVLESDGAIEIPEGKVVLSLVEDADPWLTEMLDALQPETAFQIEISCDEDWEDVQYAVGSLHKLVTGGVMESGLEKSVGPRTAVGQKADGTLVLYTVDGRQSGHSLGASMEQLAQRMIELGCVEAGIMDGGGSTNLSAILPGDGILSQVNSPSGGSARKVVNYIFLVTEEKPTGTAERLALYPLEGLNMLVGAEAELTAKAADKNGYAAAVPNNVELTGAAQLGLLLGNVFHAKKAGTGKITASAPGLKAASVPVTVVDTPDELTVYGERYGKVVEELTLEPGQEVDLRAVAHSNHVQLIADDLCFGWELEPTAGTVDATGHLTASETEGEGVLTVWAGECAVYIPITVKRPVPFDDVQEDDWYYDAVKYVYEQELFSGTGDGLFTPNGEMNRAMLVTVLWRMSGMPQTTEQSKFEDVEMDAWYAQSVAWAAENGVVSGITETSFAPTQPLTREQIAAMLHRYHTKVLGESAESGALTDFPDGDAVSGWAVESVGWATREGIITGREGGYIQPTEPATRAEVAIMLMRYLDK